MKKLAKLIYIIKLILLIANFYFIFNMLNNILDTNIYGLIFIVMYLIYLIKMILEIISKKKVYQYDIVYNLMQIGFIIYLLVISIKTTVAKLYVTRVTLSYFRLNYIILSVLIIFILIYSMLETNSITKVKHQ